LISPYALEKLLKHPKKTLDEGTGGKGERRKGYEESEGRLVAKGKPHTNPNPTK